MLFSIKNIINKCILFFTSVLTIIMVIGAFWQVFSRYILGDPSLFTEELLRFSLIWVAMLGATYAFGSNQHLAIVFLKNRLKGAKSQILRLTIDILVILFTFFILVKGGYDITVSTLSQTTPILQIPMGIVYSILPISGVLIIFLQLINIIERKTTNIYHLERKISSSGKVGE